MRKKICLNGFWDFSCETKTLEQLPANWESTQILVPSPYNINNFACGYPKTINGESFYVSGGDFRLYPEYPLHWDSAKCGFYKRNIHIPETSAGKRLFLRFDAVAYKSVYYLNGRKIGEDTEAFLPIELEITDFAEYGKDNELIVGAQLSSELKYKDENGRTRLDYPQGSFWGDQISGIWQDAWLCERPTEYIKDIFAVSDIHKKTLTIKYEYSGNSDLNIKFSLSRRGDDNAAELEIINQACDGKEAVWQYSDGDVELWDTENPALYMLTAKLERGGEIIDKTNVRIGFRTFEAVGNKFMLNGTPINLKNDSWHYMGYSVQTEEYARSYYKMAKEAHVNIIRLHAQPFPSFFYHIADEMGMLLVSESSIWASHCNFSYNPAFFDNSKEHLKRLILRDRNHPSVVMWSPENECIPAYKVCGSAYIKDVADLEDKLYDLTQVIPPLDTSRLISCDGSGDLGGRLPVNSLHYPGYHCTTHRDKPITIGEMGSMYYSTPENVSMELGEKTLNSFDGRLEAVALDAYRNLIGQRKWAAQVCVFNLIWYGLEPLEFEDKAIRYDDYTAPGIKPSRITPYLRTLNAGAQDDLPEYTGNPVLSYTKDAYTPVRFFAEDAPLSIWSGENLKVPFVLFNDSRETKLLKIKSKNTEKEYKIKACEFIEDILDLPMPPEAGNHEINIELIENGSVIFRDTLFTDIYKRETLPDIDCAVLPPYASFTKPGHVKRLFSEEGLEITFNKPLDCLLFGDYLNFNAKPILFNGKGVPVVVSLIEAGVPKILCGLDLNKHEDEPQTAQLRIMLAEMLKETVLQTPESAYFLGEADGNIAAMLNEVHCAYDIIDKEKLLKLLESKQRRTLIADGKNNLEWLKGINNNNFEKVLIMNLEKEPDLFSHKFKVSSRKAFHLNRLNRSDNAKNIGIYGNSLYGLENGNEEILSPALLLYNQKNDESVFGIPDIDWRMWNHNAEFLKTASVLKSEKVDNSLYSALSCHKYAGSEIYFSQLSLSTQSRKTKNLSVRLLSTLGCKIDLIETNELEDLLLSGLYSNKITGACRKSLADGEKAENVNPGLNRVENGGVWTLITEKQNEAKGVMAIYVYSPQDRTDLLLNPDTVDMQIKAEKDIIFYLNGKIGGRGNDFTVTSIMLKAGWNKLVFHSPESQAMPDIRFKRLNSQRLDLKFSLYDCEILTQNMQKATLFSDDQPQNLQNITSGDEKHWRASADQKNSIDLGVSFDSPVLCRAIYLNCSTDTGDVYTPYKFKILAGDSEHNLKEVYRSAPENLMYFHEGKVFIRLDDITASCFKIVLTDNALKPWIVSNMIILS